jgi:hypothetical protein
MRIPAKHLISCLCLFLLLPISLRAAEALREDVPLKGATRLDLELKVGAADLELLAHDGEPLVRYEILLMDDASAPSIDLDRKNGEVRLVLRSDSDKGFSFSIFDSNDGQDAIRSAWKVSISRDVPVDLLVEFGLGSGKAEFGGLKLEELSFATGLSDVELSFAKPTRIETRSIELASGLGSMEVRGLGNLMADNFSFAGGLGSALLDFQGELKRNMNVELDVGMGSISLRVPEGAGVKIRHEDSFLSNHEFDRLERTSSDTWYSADWQEGDHNIFFQMSVGMGSVDLEWIESR